jgi:hypothetical protein
MPKFLFISVLVLVSFVARSQYNANDTALGIPMFYANYAYQIPGGDMADRFGPNSVIGGGFQYKTRTNWIVGANFDFIFGNTLEDADSLMYNLTTENGFIIDMAGNIADVSLYQRGYTITAKVGKVIPVLSPNPNSGIYISLSTGYLQHKIRIEVQNNNVPQLNDDYKKGYDRLTGGFTLSQFVGYMYLSDSRLLNFFGGFEFTQAWTSPRRDVYFDTMEPDPKQNRLDLLNGFKIGWIIPIFQREPEKFYYY